MKSLGLKGKLVGGFLLASTIFAICGGVIIQQAPGKKGSQIRAESFDLQPGDIMNQVRAVRADIPYRA
ncbi:hypothetical protein LCGC14_3111190, partial [marine sediment metagenome]